MDLEIPENSGYPCKGVSLIAVNGWDDTITVSETDPTGVPLSNSRWRVPLNLIAKITVL